MIAFFLAVMQWTHSTALFSLNNSPVRRRLVGDERNVQVHKLHGRMGEGREWQC